MELTQQDRVELVNLYHLARTAGQDSRYDRLRWAADQYSREHDIPSIRAYKAVDEATRA